MVARLSQTRRRSASFCSFVGRNKPRAAAAAPRVRVIHRRQEHLQVLRTRFEIVADRSVGRSATIGGAIGDYVILENALVCRENRKQDAYATAAQRSDSPAASTSSEFDTLFPKSLCRSKVHTTFFVLRLISTNSGCPGPA
jgi:hypothetical protein